MCPPAQAGQMEEVMGQVVHVDFQWGAKHLGRHTESGCAKVLQFKSNGLTTLRYQVKEPRNLHVPRELLMTMSATLLPPNSWP